MAQQPGFPVAPGAGLAAAAVGSTDSDDLGTQETSTDQGVPVGADDVRADEQRASGGGDTEAAADADSSGADWPDEQAEDDGVPVGAADAEEDRRRASDEADQGE